MPPPHTQHITLLRFPLWCHASSHLICIHLCPICLFWLLSQVRRHLVSLFLIHCCLLPNFIVFSLTSLCFLPSDFRLSFVRLLLQIRQYSQGVAEASRLLISLINSVPLSRPLMCACGGNILLSLFWICLSSVTLKCSPSASFGKRCSLGILIHLFDLLMPSLLLLFMVYSNTQAVSFMALSGSPRVCVWACMLECDCVYNCQELSASKFIMPCVRREH